MPSSCQGSAACGNGFDQPTIDNFSLGQIACAKQLPSPLESVAERYQECRLEMRDERFAFGAVHGNTVQ